MNTDELIRRLRDMAKVEPPMFDELVLREAADRLEELEERLAIKEADEPHENEQSEGEQLTF